MLQNVFDLISFVGALQGVLLSIFLFSRHRKPPATIFLALYVLLFSLGLLEPFADRNISGVWRGPILSCLTMSNFLYGPLLFLFVYYLTGSISRFRNQHLIHFLPFVLLLLGEILFSYWDVIAPGHEVFLIVGFEVLVLQILTYNLKAIGRLITIKSNSAVTPGTIKWLRSLLVFITGIYVLSFLISHVILLGITSAGDLYLIVQLSITLMIYLMTYRLILDPHVFALAGGKEDTNGSQKYQRSGLKEIQANTYAATLNQYMDEKRPWLNPDLSVYSLSQQLNISRNHLTQVLNERINKNFYEFVNSYRIEEAKRLMNDPKFSHLTLTGIGLEAGFKSKTAFNLNFKKLTGFTPSEWKKLYLQIPEPTSDNPPGKSYEGVRSARTG